MSDLSVDAIGVACREHSDYRPVATLADADYVLPLARVVATSRGIPLERLRMLAPDERQAGEAADVSTLALAALGAPTQEQPLFLVRSGPLRDPYVAELARLVHEVDWTGEDVGITHLDELGGMLVFDLLEWAVPERTAATVLLCDDPLFTDVFDGSTAVAAVSLRVRRGPGPLHVLGCGEGTPGATGEDADRRFSGGRACEAWLALHTALTAGEITDGDQIVLHTQGPTREGWLALEAVDTAGLLLADATSPARSWVA